MCRNTGAEIKLVKVAHVHTKVSSVEMKLRERITKAWVERLIQRMQFALNSLQKYRNNEWNFVNT